MCFNIFLTFEKSKALHYSLKFSYEIQPTLKIFCVSFIPCFISIQPQWNILVETWQGWNETYYVVGNKIWKLFCNYVWQRWIDFINDFLNCK